jgi:hypothetical protein
MCTVSWLRNNDEYWVFFNRDERRDRKAALPPAMRTANGVAFLTPVDGECGGSWIVVNELAVTICLLNRYDETDPEPVFEPTSRGLLVLSLADASSSSDVRDRLNATRLDRFRPFTLLAFSPTTPVVASSWNGRSLETQPLADADMPIVSSAEQSAEAVAARRALFSAIRDATPESRFAFHRSHLPVRGALSPCMHRHDASTVSMSVIHVAPKRVEFVYRAGSPCSPGLETRLELTPGAHAHSVGPILGGTHQRSEEGV